MRGLHRSPMRSSAAANGETGAVPGPGCFDAADRAITAAAEVIGPGDGQHDGKSANAETEESRRQASSCEAVNGEEQHGANAQKQSRRL